MIAGAFNDWFTLAHRARASDGQGGWTETYVPYATERGRMQLLGRAAAVSQELKIGEQLTERISHIFYCRTAVPIQRGDQITDGAGVNYLVLDVRASMVGGGGVTRNHTEAKCREVQQGQ